MFADRDDARKVLANAYPSTLKPLQNMVMAMAAVQNNLGKTSFFGKDKGLAAFEKFVTTIPLVIHGLMEDEIISSKDGATQLILEIEAAIHFFSGAYPNWKDAYTFSDNFFGEKNRRVAIESIQQLGYGRFK